MAKKTGKRTPLQNLVAQSVADLQNSGFEVDPTLDAEDNELTGPERFAKGRKQKDEVLIDSMLGDIAGKEGYFLKLKKEMRPNEWMLMKTIYTEWRKWPDVETAVADIVKEHTKIAPLKWGSGPYRIEYACKGGIRGKQYEPFDFYINAEEEFLPNQPGQGQVAQPADATTQVTAQLEMLGKLTDIINSNKAPGLDPGQVQSQIAGAFEKGLEIKATEGSQSNQMMMTMMTGLMGMMTALATKQPVEASKVVNEGETLNRTLETLKNFGVLGGASDKPKGLTDTLLELKSIGIDIFKKEDPMEQMSKLKQFASIASDLMGLGGTGEKPGILEKLVDMVGPSIPGMIKDAKDAMGNVAQAQIEAGRNIERARVTGPANQPVVHPNNDMQGTQMNTAPQQAQTNPQVVAFFNGLYDAVNKNNRLYYPIVYASLVSDPKGMELISGILSGTHTAKELIELLQSFGDARFRDELFMHRSLIAYVNGFIIWLRDMNKPKSFNEATQEIPATSGFVAPKGPGFDVECPVCKQEFVLESAEDLKDEQNKVCGQNGCTGVLQPLQKI
jgi:hypothetical protein